jgi:hypothetical protein
LISLKFFRFIGATDDGVLLAIKEIFHLELQLLQSVKLELKQLEECKPATEFIINTSETCKTNAYNTFRQLMESLRLPVENNLKHSAKNPTEQQNSTKINVAKNISFDWNELEMDGNAIKESASYPFVESYLKTEFNIKALNVSNGLGLMDSLLFDVKIYTMQTATDIVHTKLNGTYRKQLMKYRLCGNTDIVILKDESRGVCCGNLLCSIEIKPHKDFNTPESINAGLREGSLQLIGTNAGNVYSSPSVLVIDLINNNYLLYILTHVRATSISKFFATQYPKLNSIVISEDESNICEKNYIR